MHKEPGVKTSCINAYAREWMHKYIHMTIHAYKHDCMYVFMYINMYVCTYMQTLSSMHAFRGCVWICMDLDEW